MPEPQPGTDRPADGSTPDPQRDRDPAVTVESAPAPVPSADGPRTGPEGTHELPVDEPAATAPPDGPDGARDRPADPADEAPAERPAPGDAATERPAPGEAPAERPSPGAAPAERSGAAPAGPAERPAAARDERPAAPAAGTAAAPDERRTAPAAEPEAAAEGRGPQGTRKLPADDPLPEPPAPRWSGSAAVPPPPPRKRSWGESVEPTPVPPAHPEPEHQVPVDPWAGADTGGWDLPSAELPELPPTLPYPSPPPTRPYSGPSAAGSPAAPHPPAGYPGPPPPPPAYPVSPSPVPARPAPPPPPPARPKQRRRGRGAPPVAPPPGWQAPKGYVPVPVRRRRRWPWLLLLTLVCCCGCPAWFAAPMASQYPAKAVLPAEVDDLRLRKDSRSEEAARKLENEVRQAHWLAEDTFAGLYTTQTGKRVTVFGGTGFRLTPEADADAEIARLTERYALGEAQVVDTQVRGRHGRCAVGRSEGAGVVVCTSVDHGSIATAVFTRLSMEDSAALLGTLREQIVTAGTT